ncbi:Kinesin- protein 6 [Allomyces javanicus]|nr:Kinesin- protein 6 [Allomyces javanicus]
MMPESGADDPVATSPRAPAAADTVDDSIASDAPLNQAIKIFARIRPRKANPNIKTGLGSGPSKIVVDGPIPGDSGEPQLHFHLPRNEAQGLINNIREHFGFRFDRVFDEQTTQEEIFDHVAKEAVQSVMDGFNATIFAYGQTGSGKTFTITGGAEKYSDRGLIPRTIQFIFKEMAKRPNRKYQVSVSYLEIYNESGFDLLDDNRDAKQLEDLPKVILREREDQNIYLQNLSAHPALTEEEALNWLFVGDTNKMIAETPSNPASSRSHCLFILTVTSREEGSEVLRRSKLHLVDLAGSERVAKTGIDGTLLREAKHINLSLHYLEQVIVALHEKSLGKRMHIPYRNSMMTSILRDSLGGNCKTCMIATLATEEHLLEESISTCRFAQRVALISNRVSVNEEVDPQLIIAKLRAQVAQLKAELALLRGDAGGDPTDELPDYEIDRCRQLIEAFLAGDDGAMIFTDYRKVTACFRLLRDRTRGIVVPLSAPRAVTRTPVPAASPSPAPASAPAPALDPAAASEVKRLMQLLVQRDTEISVLVPMVNQYKAKLVAYERAGGGGTSGAGTNGSRAATDPSRAEISMGSTMSLPSTSTLPSMASLAETPPAPPRAIGPEDRAVLLEAFKQTYAPMAVIEEQKSTLKQRYAEAKELGQQASQLRNEIKQCKELMSQRRAEYEAYALANPVMASPAAIEAEEAKIREAITGRTQEYRTKFQQLKELKIEIEHLQHLLDNAKLRLNTDFEAWLQQQATRSAPNLHPFRPAPHSTKPTASSRSTLPTTSRDGGDSALGHSTMSTSSLLGRAPSRSASRASGLMGASSAPSLYTSSSPPPPPAHPAPAWSTPPPPAGASLVSTLLRSESRASRPGSRMRQAQVMEDVAAFMAARSRVHPPA